MKKRVFAALAAFILFTESAYASVLGGEVTGWNMDIACGTQLYQNTYMSEQEGVGRQTEFYAKYTPNENITPVVVSGESLWGLKNIQSVEKYMKENGMVPMIGINSSFFSSKTGLPMGHVIENGRIVSKDTETYQSIGFLPSGKGVIAPLDIKTELTFNDTVVDIAHINKYNQESTAVLNLYTNDYGESNHSESPALTLILGDVDGKLMIGEKLTATVEEKFNYHSSIIIPEGKLVLTINEIAEPSLYDAVNSLEIGDRVTISSSTSSPEVWEGIESAVGSVGDTLIKNGEIQPNLPSGTAPRTAVGVTADGEIIFYVIDGRQPGYSYGVRLQTLANRMMELGCVEAINLDGGGSSVISGVYPGYDNSSIINSPSDGSVRKSSTYIFLKNNQTPTGNTKNLHIYPFEQHYLDGYTEELTVLATDSAFYKTETPKKLKFSVTDGESIVDAEGMLTAKGNGKFTVKATDGKVSGTADFYSYNTPTEIEIFNKDTKEKIESLTLLKGDTINLTLKAKYNELELKSTDNCFKIEIIGDFGIIEGNKLTITKAGTKGILRVSAGDFAKEIPVEVIRNIPFDDISEHWAKDIITEIFKLNIISGYEQGNEILFMPDKNMTREEFAVVVSRLLDIDTEGYRDYDLSSFKDLNDISDWAKPYVSAMVDKNLITGKADGKFLNFAPKDTLKRAEAMTVLGRIVGSGEDEIHFTDNDSIPEWAKGYIAKMVSLNIVSGYEDNTIRPLETITRAEVVTLIYKLLGALES